MASYLANLWLGVSVENQATADKRIPASLGVPAAVHWVSMEPLLGPIDIEPYLTPRCAACEVKAASGSTYDRPHTHEHISWCVVGGESGPGARPMDLDWVRSIRDQCQEDGVPFFFKQKVDGGKKVHMPELDGRIWDEYPGVQGE